MCDKRKLLIAAIVFTAFSFKVTSTQLDMALDAVDDQYNGCRKEAMEKFIHSGLLKQELNRSEEFQKAWHDKSKCSKLIPGGTEEHNSALLAYAEDEAFSATFDNEVATTGANVSTYEDHFHFKSLHFLLMDSIALLKPKACKTLHMIREKCEAQKGSKVRFGRFTKVQSNYRDLKEMNDLDGQVVFNITSCFFVNLGDICGGLHDTVLLSPAEVFTVEEVTAVKDETNDSDYTVIVMKHSTVNSTHNCYSFSRSPADVSMQWLVFMLMSCASISFLL